MAVPLNSFQRVSQIGVRETLEEKIYDVSPEDHMCASAIGSQKSDGVLFEWQTDALRASNAANAMIDSDDFTINAVTPTKRLANHCQIFQEGVKVSGRASSANTAGRKEELANQLERRMLTLKKDVEKRLLSSLPATAPTTSVAPTFAGFGACISWATAGNGSHGVGGATPAWASGAQTVAPTAGTARTFTEALLKQVAQACYTGGGEMKMLFMSPGQKARASAFAGIAQIRKDVPGKQAATIIGAADYYVTDWGDLMFVADRECDPGTVFGINPEFASVRVHRAMFKKELPSNGDYRGFGIAHDCTLQVNNELAHFKVADLTP
jgi:hypothetical protein